MPHLKVEYTCPMCKQVRWIEKQTINRQGFSGECYQCARGKATIVHGESHTRLNYVWISMKARCMNPANKGYKHYGGRGITVCDRWLKYENFRDDMGYPEKGMTLERVDNDGPYSPENCRWANYKEQARNKRNSRLLTFSGKTQSLAQWAEEIGWNYFTLHKRINFRGWSAEKAFTTPIRAMHRRS